MVMDSVIGSGLGRDEPIYIPDESRCSNEHFVLPRHYKTSLENVVLPRGLIEDRVEWLARQIRAHYGDEEVFTVYALWRRGGTSYCPWSLGRVGM